MDLAQPVTLGTGAALRAFVAVGEVEQWIAAYEG